MKIRFGGLIAIAFVIVTTFLLIPASAMAQSAASKDIPRLPNGKPDFSGVWDHPRVLDVTRDGKGCGGGTPGCTQKGNGELSLTPCPGGTRGQVKWSIHSRSCTNPIVWPSSMNRITFFTSSIWMDAIIPKTWNRVGWDIP